MLAENIRTNDLNFNVVAHACALGADDGWSLGPAEAGGYGINYTFAFLEKQSRARAHLHAQPLCR